ncbi:hypothetical protein Cantr_10463 [Candida viswanathii]|uniref:Cell wall protein RHD3 n=1 Tax=Candida viswanathii TaxID=5486 RepID=A0A367YEB2_9ASCO|nr:hypothetical protein Cantr_10463 [Candida viswanathii]
MNYFATLLFSLIALFLQAEAAPLYKRIYTPTSPVFSLLAIHNGSITNADVLTFNGSSVKVGTDDSPFFGRIDAAAGYVLNVPFTNVTNRTSPVNVLVDEETYQLTTTASNSTVNGTEGFGIDNGYLTFENSTNFLVCSELPLNRTLNETGGFLIYANPKNTSTCEYGPGFSVKLLTELVISFSYSPSTNTGFFKRQLQSIAPAAGFPVKRNTAQHASVEAKRENDAQVNGLLRFFKKFF